MSCFQFLLPDCEKLQVILKNDILSKQGNCQVTYQINKIVNGRLSWKSASNAIWFLPAKNAWRIGSLNMIGGNRCGIFSLESEGYKTPDQVPNEKWKYVDNGWRNVQSGDVVINCVQGKAPSVSYIDSTGLP